MHLARSQRNRTEDQVQPFFAGRKLREVEQALLWSMLQEDRECPSRVLLDKLTQRQFAIAVSLRPIHRWRAERGLNRAKGRPRHAHGCRPVAPGAEIVRITPHVAFVGVHLCALWLDQHHAFSPVVVQLRQAIASHTQTHPGDDFALLHHRDSTLLRRVHALFFAPLLGIDRLSEFYTREHSLQMLLVRGYHSSTLRQFLGQLERVGAAEPLMPVLGANGVGQIIDVDGHMIASWSRRSMHKAKIYHAWSHHGGLASCERP